MSGVNCTRANASDSDCDSARTSSVLPRPGTPSMSTWPEATSAISTCSTTSDWPTIAWPMAVRRLADEDFGLGNVVGIGLHHCGSRPAVMRRE